MKQVTLTDHEVEQLLFELHGSLAIVENAIKESRDFIGEDEILRGIIQKLEA